MMNCCPLIEEITTRLTAPEAFELFKDNPHSFFLDSGMNPQRLGRYSFMGSDPFLVLRSQGKEINLSWQDRQEVEHGNPFDTLDRLLRTYTLDSHEAPAPFLGGAVGYLSYDLCHLIEHLPATTTNDLKLPESYFAFYDTILAFDHLKNRTYIVATGFPELDEQLRLTRAKMNLAQMARQLALPAVPTSEPNTLSSVIRNEVVLKSNFTPEAYIKAVDRVREYIAAGDVFQVNLSQRFETELTISPYSLYQRLRQVNPAPFASYLNFDGVTIVSASPERFLRLDDNWVETRPIKGTRPRGKDIAEDIALADALSNSTKDQAENIMIVDLERNDIGRVCQYGTVKVTELAILETFPTVFHLTSTIVGKLSHDKNRLALLKATFPGGSITGAPKVRAMEIIDELEPTRRSVYTGAIGYLSFGDKLDLNIVIRTFLVKDGKAYFQVGGGITYDSDPESEYLETLDKARALVQALQLAQKVAVEVK